MNSNRAYWAVLLLCLIANIAHAVTIQSTGSQYEPGGVRYYFTVTGWEGGGDSFCNDMKAVTCGISLVGAQRPGEYQYMVFSEHYWSGLRPSTSMAEVRKQMTGFSIPFQGSLFVPESSKVSDSFCISFASGYSYVGAGGLIAPVGPCVSVNKPALQCELTGKTIIDHGNVSDAAIDGNVAETTLQLKCTGVSSVIVTLLPAVNLRTDRSLYSKLTVLGKNAAGGINIYTGNGLSTPVSIKSTLFSNGTVEPGAFSGSTVLTISPP